MDEIREGATDLLRMQPNVPSQWPADDRLFAEMEADVTAWLEEVAAFMSDMLERAPDLVATHMNRPLRVLFSPSQSDEHAALRDDLIRLHGVLAPRIAIHARTSTPLTKSDTGLIAGARDAIAKVLERHGVDNARDAKPLEEHLCRSRRVMLADESEFLVGQTDGPYEFFERHVDRLSAPQRTDQLSALVVQRLLGMVCVERELRAFCPPTDGADAAASVARTDVERIEQGLLYGSEALECQPWVMLARVHFAFCARPRHQDLSVSVRLSEEERAALRAQIVYDERGLVRGALSSLLGSGGPGSTDNPSARGERVEPRSVVVQLDTNRGTLMVDRQELKGVTHNMFLLFWLLSEDAGACVPGRELRDKVTNYRQVAPKVREMFERNGIHDHSPIVTVKKEPLPAYQDNRPQWVFQWKARRLPKGRNPAIKRFQAELV